MQFTVLLLLIQSLIFCIQYKHTYASPLVGDSVTDVESGEYKAIVALLYVVEENGEEEFDFQCSGVIVAPKHVLTAAHCLEQKLVANVRLLMGTNVITTNNLHNVSWWITYSDWLEIDENEESINRHDVAIIRLVNNVNRNLQPATFSPIRNELLLHISATIIGWSESDDNPDLIIMKKVEVRTLGNRLCRQKSLQDDAQVIDFEKRFLCSYANPYALLNYGDSGAPMFYQGKVIGINVGTCPTTNNNIEKVNFHIGVHYYNDFIQYYINAT